MRLNGAEAACVGIEDCWPRSGRGSAGLTAWWEGGQGGWRGG